MKMEAEMRAAFDDLLWLLPQIRIEADGRAVRSMLNVLDWVAGGAGGEIFDRLLDGLRRVRVDEDIAA